MKQNLTKVAKVMAAFVFLVAMFLNIQSNLAGELSIRGAFGSEGSGTGSGTVKDNKTICAKAVCAVVVGIPPMETTH